MGRRAPDDRQVESASHASLSLQNLRVGMQDITGEGIKREFGTPRVQVNIVIGTADEFA
jgi:hypothetical protein